MKSKVGVVDKPWGQYEVHMTNNHCVMKTLTVQPGQSLSYQYHNYRNEFWFIACGTGIFTLNGNDFKVEHGDTFNILVKDKHRISNTGKSPLVVYEMQYGPKCEEDDIVRIKDNYDRV